MTVCLVTGGGGFLGQYIVEHLVARGDEVRSLSRMRHRALDSLGVKHIQGDIRDPETVASVMGGVDTCWHLAAAHHDSGIDTDTYGRTSLHDSCLSLGCGK